MTEPGNRVVFVVSFRGEGAGGFDWFYKQEDAAQRFAEALRDVAEDEALGSPSLVKYIGAMEVPDGDNDSITQWIDQNWDLWDFPAPWDAPDWDREQWLKQRQAQGVQS